MSTIQDRISQYAKKLKAKTPIIDVTRQKQIKSDWDKFSKSEAYKDLMEYADKNRDMLIHYAEERAMPGPKGHGIVSLDNEGASALLQNARGIHIITAYIRQRSE